jgi:anion-transporting  ArsA/GET3 family ATPase
MDAKGSLAAAYEVAELRFDPRRIEANLEAMAMNTEDSLREYLRLFVRVPFVGRIGPLARTFDFVADAAPGVKEILSVGKLCYEVRERNYDTVIVDAEASGHIVSQINAPAVIADLVQVGLVRDQTQWMIDILHDDTVTGLVVVTTPEEMPVTETIELLERLDRESGVAVAAVVANRVLPALFDRRHADAVERLADAEPLLVERAGEGVDAVLAAAQITERRRAIGAEHLERLRDVLESGSDHPPQQTPIVYVPELFTRSSGRRVVNLVAGALSDELDTGA